MRERERERAGGLHYSDDYVNGFLLLPSSQLLQQQQPPLVTKSGTAVVASESPRCSEEHHHSKYRHYAAASEVGTCPLPMEATYTATTTRIRCATRRRAVHVCVCRRNPIPCDDAGENIATRQNYGVVLRVQGAKTVRIGETMDD